ncbi:hypothetical protein CHLNCDRAFT_18747, partial [Chlorella variabilis]
RVYDSKYGVTCHWCRQKTLEEHVTCSHPDCGDGRRLAVSFCKLCLRNRQGEDIAQAEASGKWVCPRCRGSCGDGCASCCNCGPCRKALGLAPTHQIINQARGAGFDNVHDFLVRRRGWAGLAVAGCWCLAGLVARGSDACVCRAVGGWARAWGGVGVAARR